MFLDFFLLLKNDGLPASLHEYLALLEALEQQAVGFNLDDFYALSKSILIKHENQLDRFDQLFAQYFKGLEAKAKNIAADIPEEWLRKNFDRIFSDEEKALIQAMGGLDKLLERLQQLLDEQQERHEGGNRWIGTGGTSPFGANGYNPEGIRIGQEGSGSRSAVKVWDERRFANLDDNVELNTRNIKLALKRLRVFTREGIADELDLEDTIRKTSENAGLLDITMIPSKKNRVKILLLLDVGGSMDDHVETCSQLFSAARHEFKHLEHYYFHNCLYETVWKDNQRRYVDRIPTWELLHRYNSDYKLIFVGDAAMAPYELYSSNGSLEHQNSETGIAWLKRMTDHFPYFAWINPNPLDAWSYYQTTVAIRELFEHRMFPMTLPGLSLAMKSLKNKKVRYEAESAFLGSSVRGKR
ncbi:MAG: VWA domain-containing protein [Chitinophagales bacterium]|nr:VWA domain-containing protein [Chitinophagales bacterium]